MQVLRTAVGQYDLNAAAAGSDQWLSVPSMEKFPEECCCFAVAGPLIRIANGGREDLLLG